MKTLFKFSALVMLFACSFGLSSCEKESGTEEDVNLAQKVCGTYVGKGELTYYGIDMESFAGMKVEVRRSSNDYVLLDFYRADNSLLFGDEVYQVLQTGSKEYLLRSEEFPAINVSISENKVLKYSSPYITVGGESGYTLTFEGKREN